MIKSESILLQRSSARGATAEHHGRENLRPKVRPTVLPSVRRYRFWGGESQDNSKGEAKECHLFLKRKLLSILLSTNDSGVDIRIDRQSRISVKFLRLVYYFPPDEGGFKLDWRQLEQSEKGSLCFYQSQLP